MEHAYYTIGKVSQATGISKDTLHFYNKIGLLVPDYIDPNNRYRYYSLRNLWQLDIITTCRKLNIPLETVKQILSLRDNAEITKLLMEYRQEAIRLSQYYQQVAEDILWYGEEHEQKKKKKDITTIQEKWLDEEVVIAGKFKLCFSIFIKWVNSSFHYFSHSASYDGIGNRNRDGTQYSDLPHGREW